MSASTKKKYVEQEVSYDLVLPKPPTFIARLVAGRGNNLHEAESEHGETFLISMPPKYRKNVWVKRGDFVLCEPIAEGDKVKAEIVHVLLKDNIRYIRNNGLWPQRFQDDLLNILGSSTTPSGSSTKAETSSAYAIDKEFLPPSCSSSSEESGGENEGNNSGYNSSSERSVDENNDDQCKDDNCDKNTSVDDK